MRRSEMLLGAGLAVLAHGASAQESVNIRYVPPTLTVRGADTLDGVGTLVRNHSPYPVVT